MALQVVAYTIEKMVRTTQPMRVGTVVVSHLVCDSQEKKLRKDAKEKAEGHNHNPKNNTTTSSNGNNNAAKEGPTAAMPVPPTSARMQNVLQNGLGASFSSSFNSIQSTPTNKVSGVVFRNAHSPLTCFIFFNGDFNGVF
jgi:BRCT domain type II-containing protein